MSPSPLLHEAPGTLSSMAPFPWQSTCKVFPQLRRVCPYPKPVFFLEILCWCSKTAHNNGPSPLCKWQMRIQTYNSADCQSKSYTEFIGNALPIVGYQCLYMNAILYFYCFKREVENLADLPCFRETDQVPTYCLQQTITVLSHCTTFLSHRDAL
jgi:hypothetical protein